MLKLLKKICSNSRPTLVLSEDITSNLLDILQLFENVLVVFIQLNVDIIRIEAGNLRYLKLLVKWQF